MEYENNLPTHPGETLCAFMSRYHVSVYDIHSETDIPMEVIEDIAAGDDDISHDSAFLFGQFFSTGTKFWLDLQSDYNKKMMEM
jgi:addiction module HigA family antidote